MRTTRIPGDEGGRTNSDAESIAVNAGAKERAPRVMPYSCLKAEKDSAGQAASAARPKFSTNSVKGPLAGETAQSGCADLASHVPLGGHKGVGNAAAVNPCSRRDDFFGERGRGATARCNPENRPPGRFQELFVPVLEVLTPFAAACEIRHGSGKDSAASVSDRPADLSAATI
jgi:hypothetical protein